MSASLIILILGSWQAGKSSCLSRQKAHCCPGTMAAGAGLGARDRDLGGAGEPDAAHQEEVDGNRHGCRDFPVLGPPPRAAPEAHQQEHGASMRGSLEHSFTPSEAASAVASARRAAWSDCAFDRKVRLCPCRYTADEWARDPAQGLVWLPVLGYSTSAGSVQALLSAPVPAPPCS